MLKLFLVMITASTLTACGQINTNDASNKLPNKMKILSNDQKMDTIHFWEIMDYAFNKGKFDNEVKEQAILEQLLKLTPKQIQDFEIIFQQMNKRASTWGAFAAQTVIEGGSSDDRFYYFRCWLISLGKKNFDEVLKNPDHLASLDLPFNKSYGLIYCEFENLIAISDRAFELVTKKDPEKDSTFPRSHAMKLNLFYDSSTPMLGIEWTSNDDLPKIVPLLCKKYPDN